MLFVTSYYRTDSRVTNFRGRKRFAFLPIPHISQNFLPRPAIVGLSEYTLVGTAAAAVLLAALLLRILIFLSSLLVRTTYRYSSYSYCLPSFRPSLPPRSISISAVFFSVGFSHEYIYRTSSTRTVCRKWCGACFPFRRSSEQQCPSSTGRISPRPTSRRLTRP